MSQLPHLTVAPLSSTLRAIRATPALTDAVMAELDACRSYLAVHLPWIATLTAADYDSMIRPRPDQAIYILQADLSLPAYVATIFKQQQWEHTQKISAQFALTSQTGSEDFSLSGEDKQAHKLPSPAEVIAETGLNPHEFFLDPDWIDQHYGKGFTKDSQSAKPQTLAQPATPHAQTPVSAQVSEQTHLSTSSLEADFKKQTTIEPAKSPIKVRDVRLEQEILDADAFNRSTDSATTLTSQAEAELHEDLRTLVLTLISLSASPRNQADQRYIKTTNRLIAVSEADCTGKLKLTSTKALASAEKAQVGSEFNVEQYLTQLPAALDKLVAGDSFIADLLTKQAQAKNEANSTPQNQASSQLQNQSSSHLQNQTPPAAQVNAASAGAQAPAPIELKDVVASYLKQVTALVTKYQASVACLLNMLNVRCLVGQVQVNIEATPAGLTKSANLGYFLFYRYTGLGLMTQALAGICASYYQEEQVRRFVIHSQVDNYASQALAIRLGAKHEGRVRAYFADGTDAQTYSYLLPEDQLTKPEAFYSGQIELEPLSAADLAQQYHSLSQLEQSSITLESNLSLQELPSHGPLLGSTKPTEVESLVLSQLASADEIAAQGNASFEAVSLSLDGQVIGQSRSPMPGLTPRHTFTTSLQNLAAGNQNNQNNQNNLNNQDNLNNQNNLNNTVVYSEPVPLLSDFDLHAYRDSVLQVLRHAREFSPDASEQAEYFMEYARSTNLAQVLGSHAYEQLKTTGSLEQVVLELASFEVEPDYELWTLLVNSLLRGVNVPEPETQLQALAAGDFVRQEQALGQAQAAYEDMAAAARKAGTSAAPSATGHLRELDQAAPTPQIEPTPDQAALAEFLRQPGFSYRDYQDSTGLDQSLLDQSLLDQSLLDQSGVGQPESSLDHLLTPDADLGMLYPETEPVNAFGGLADYNQDWAPTAFPSHVQESSYEQAGSFAQNGRFGQTGGFEAQYGQAEFAAEDLSEQFVHAQFSQASQEEFSQEEFNQEEFNQEEFNQEEFSQAQLAQPGYPQPAYPHSFAGGFAEASAGYGESSANYGEASANYGEASASFAEAAAAEEFAYGHQAQQYADFEENLPQALPALRGQPAPEAGYGTNLTQHAGFHLALPVYDNPNIQAEAKQALDSFSALASEPEYRSAEDYADYPMPVAAMPQAQPEQVPADADIEGNSGGNSGGEFGAGSNEFAASSDKSLKSDSSSKSSLASNVQTPNLDSLLAPHSTSPQAQVELDLTATSAVAGKTAPVEPTVDIIGGIEVTTAPTSGNVLVNVEEFPEIKRDREAHARAQAQKQPVDATDAPEIATETTGATLFGTSASAEATDASGAPDASDAYNSEPKPGSDGSHNND